MNAKQRRKLARRKANQDAMLDHYIESELARRREYNELMRTFMRQAYGRLTEEKSHGGSAPGLVGKTFNMPVSASWRDR